MEKISELLKLLAFTNGRRKIQISDCMVLIYCCWMVKEQIEELKNWVIPIFKRYKMSIQKNIWVPQTLKNSLIRANGGAGAQRIMFTKELQLKITYLREKLHRVDSLLRNANDLST
eukprot:TRINITY_DN9487_c1_g1_i1.p1 TRINITY_DN9487_c1_g1~~TRINITY_DN9487_c1_g1_i1.p1  ORF type:complete len:116 (-),score=25.20 TRINITY_DN9487_c1_g1_i1:379-726(-)